VIESSFCFLPGIGAKTERTLWQQGLLSWAGFLSAPAIRGIGAVRKARSDREILSAIERHVGGDARYFGVVLPSRDHWRLYEWLRTGVVYLDIETDAFGRITVVGLYSRKGMRSFVRGESLDGIALSEELRRYDLLVTFCGTTFDVPMLLKQFPDLPLDHPHMDLCAIGRRLGYRGGLKAIERRLGINRPDEINGLNGSDAVRLWNRWRHRRDEQALARLLAYNQADCVNLEPLADAFYCRMVQSTSPSSTA
jgi:uncharacterized protein YprB with RNaseH-like and TPR domain